MTFRKFLLIALLADSIALLALAKVGAQECGFAGGVTNRDLAPLGSEAAIDMVTLSDGRIFTLAKVGSSTPCFAAPAVNPFLVVQQVAGSKTCSWARRGARDNMKTNSRYRYRPRRRTGVRQARLGGRQSVAATRAGRRSARRLCDRCARRLRLRRREQRRELRPARLQLRR